MDPSFKHDPDFIRLLRGGDEWAFKIVYSETIEVIKNYVNKNWGYYSEDQRQDFIATAYYNLFKGRDKINDFNHVQCLLFVTVKHLVRDHWLKNKTLQNSKRSFDYLCDTYDVMDVDEKVDHIGMLREAVSKLSRRKKQVIHLLFYEEKSAGEVSDILGVSVQTVLNWKTRGIDQLMKRLPFAGKKIKKSRSVC